MGFVLVRFARDGYCFADCPVVLRFDSIQPEISHLQLAFDRLELHRISNTVSYYLVPISDL